MKICHVMWGFAYGGIETMVVNIANEQTDLDHDVTLLIINNLIDDSLVKLLSPNVKIYCLRRNIGSKNPLPIFNLNARLISMRCDVIHLHHAGIYNYLIPSLRKKSCTTHHIDCTPSIKDQLAKIPRLFSISKYVQDDILKHTGKKSTLVCNGIDPRKFMRKTNVEEYNGKNKFRIVQIGRLDIEQKGQDILIKAARILKDRKYDFKIDIIGKGPSMAYLSEIIENDGLGDCVELVGAKPPEYIWKNLSSYDLLVQPSRYEGFGLTIAEGMAARVPVLVSDIEVQLDVIGHGKCGYYFRSEDAESCADAICEIIKHYDMTIADHALERVAKLYDVRVTAKNYIEEYIKLLHKDQ